MGSWIKRTAPYTFLESEDPPIPQQGAWLKMGASVPGKADHPADLTGDPDPSHWKVVGDEVIRKDQSVIDAADAASLELSQFEVAVVAQGEIVHGEALRDAMQLAGKSLTRINAKISGATNRRDNAISKLPDA